MGKTVLFHGHCPDGIASALACWERFGNTATYLPVFYGQPCPNIPPEDDIFVVDFSYPEETLKAWLATRIGRRKRGEYVVTVLDHHLSAQRDLWSLQRQGLPWLQICFDLAESGASLTWKYLKTGGWAPGKDPDPHGLEHSMPLFYKYVRDRDLWEWRLPDSKAVSLAYRVHQQDSWIDLAQFAQDLDEAEGYQRIVTEGRAMERYANMLVQEQAARALEGTLAGYEVPIVNATTLFSEVGEYLCQTRPDIPFAAYFFDRQDRRQWGLRGHGKVDLSSVAQQFGGGGHFSAAGFTTERGWFPS